MKYTTFKIDLHCDLTGEVIGFAEVSSEFGWTAETATEAVYRAEHSIIDQRSTQAEAEHGSFREMVAEYEQKIGAEPLEAETFVKANPRREEFTTALETVVEEIKLDQLDKEKANGGDIIIE